MNKKTTLAALTRRATAVVAAGVLALGTSAFGAADAFAQQPAQPIKPLDEGPMKPGDKPEGDAKPDKPDEKPGDKPAEKPGEKAKKPDNAVQAEGGDNPLGQLGACIANNDELDVLLLMDETNSLTNQWKDGKKLDGKPGADPDNLRIPAAQAFAKVLLQKSEDQNLTTNIKVAGFGTTYKNDVNNPGEGYEGWTELTDASQGDVIKQIQAFEERTEETKGTDHNVALEGASEDLLNSPGEDPCRLLVTFTDGKLATADDKGAEDNLCRPNGVADRLRSAGITHVGIGLTNPELNENFDLFQAITEGEAAGITCGKQPRNGAFYPANKVGDLFAAFRSALDTGGSAGQTTHANEPFTFVLDNSITSVRFSVVGRDDLGPDAKLEMTAPNGDTVVMEDSGEKDAGGGKVAWEARNDAVQSTEGSLSKTGDKDWAGEWSMRFIDIAPEAEKDGEVFNLVEMVPELNVTFSADGADDAAATDSEGSKNDLKVMDDGKLVVELTGSDGKVVDPEGKATGKVEFVPSGGGKPVVLEEKADFSSGRAEIPASKIPDAPASGRVTAEVTITTAGKDGKPGTTLSPLRGDSAVSVAVQNLPQLPGQIDVTTEGGDVTVNVPVSGPGRVWVDGGQKVEHGMEDLGTVTVDSEHNSKDSALSVGRGETAELPLKFTFEERAQLIANGTLPVHIADENGGEERVVDVATRIDSKVPVSKGIAAVAFTLALLLGLLLPLLLLYLVRYLTSKIPNDPPVGPVVLCMSRGAGGAWTFDGQLRPQIDPTDAAQRQMRPGPRSVQAGRAQAQVESFSFNPLSAANVIVSTPSIASDGKEKDGHAVLPLAVQDSWFVHAPSQSADDIEVVAFPRIPIAPAAQEQLQNEIASEAPALADALAERLPSAEPAPGQFDQGGGFAPPSDAGANGNSAGWVPPQGGNQGFGGGAGTGPAGGWTPPAGPPGPPGPAGPAGPTGPAGPAGGGEPGGGGGSPWGPPSGNGAGGAGSPWGPPPQ